MAKSAHRPVFRLIEKLPTLVIRPSGITCDVLVPALPAIGQPTVAQIWQVEQCDAIDLREVDLMVSFHVSSAGWTTALRLEIHGDMRYQ